MLFWNVVTQLINFSIFLRATYFDEENKFEDYVFHVKGTVWQLFLNSGKNSSGSGIPLTPKEPLKFWSISNKKVQILLVGVSLVGASAAVDMALSAREQLEFNKKAHYLKEYELGVITQEEYLEKTKNHK